MTPIDDPAQHLVRDVMQHPVLSVAPDDPLDLAHSGLTERGVSCFAVVDGERLVGVVSGTDLVRVGRLTAHAPHVDPDAPALELPEVPVADVMTRRVVTVTEDATLGEAAARMAEAHIHRVFVVRDGAAVGVVSTRDVMGVIARHRLDRPISDLMTSPVLSVDVECTLGEANDELVRAAVRGLVVVADGWPVGVFTQAEALARRHASPSLPVEDAMDPAVVCLPVGTALHRAAALAATMQVRRIVAVDRRQMEGVLTGFDLVRAIATPTP